MIVVYLIVISVCFALGVLSLLLDACVIVCVVAAGVTGLLIGLVLLSCCASGCWL